MLIAVESFTSIVCVVGTVLIVRELNRLRRELILQQLVSTFAPAAARAQSDPRELLIWYPLAERLRGRFPGAFHLLDAPGARFPFDPSQLAAAHARWTTEWLAWERAHDSEYRIKAVEQEQRDRRADSDPTAARSRQIEIEREKLERYQQRYEEYVRVSKALASLGDWSR